MKTSALIAFITLLIIGVALNSQEQLPKFFSDVGITAALIGGIGFGLYIIFQIRMLR